jgi:lysozyme family protein
MLGFEQAVEFILQKEGGYVKDPSDSGGETNMGISKRSYPHIDIRTLTTAQAKEIYHRDYWDALHLDSLPYRVAVVVFDTAVNSGNHRAVVLLQQSIGVGDDGVIGPATQAKLKEATSTESGSKILSLEYMLRRMKYYRSIIQGDRSKGKYMAGWYSRVMDLFSETMREEKL